MKTPALVVDCLGTDEVVDGDFVVDCLIAVVGVDAEEAEAVEDDFT